MKHQVLQGFPDGAGTHLVGYITTPLTYSQIAMLLGPSHDSDEYKVSCEWVIEFEDHKIATIYDWKETSLYDSDLPDPEDIREDRHVPEWHIGGNNPDVVKRVGELLGANVRVYA
jgi:hypothetical protein